MGQNNGTIFIALQGKKLIENAIGCRTGKLDCVHADSDAVVLGIFCFKAQFLPQKNRIKIASISQI